jgi:hypothetical protein
VDTITGTGGFQTLSLIYNNKKPSYDVTITAMTANCRFPHLRFRDQKLISLNVKDCITLENLWCIMSELIFLDASGCTSLVYLSCGGAGLAFLNVSGCTALTDLTCSGNQLSTLDVSSCTALTDLTCSGNPFRTLDVSGCMTLSSLECAWNQLSSLKIPSLYNLDCSNNYLQLSDLYDISKKIYMPNMAFLGPQRIPLREVSVGDTIDFSAQRQFIEFKSPYLWINTIFTVDAHPTYYMVNNGIITFKKIGKYTVTMSNTAIISSPSVIAEFNVINTSDATLSNLEVSSGILSPFFTPSSTYYIVSVGNDETEITITATPNSPYATISGDTGVQPLQVGNNNFFTITVTAEDEVTQKNYVVRVNRSVGVTETMQEIFNIYPNPTRNQLRITNYELRNGEIEIFDVLGRKQKGYEVQGTGCEVVDVSHLPSGIYFIKVNEIIKKITKI